MHFMNSPEIDWKAEQYRNHPILGRATQTLVRLRDKVDSCSDGWAYWSAPVRAADKLMTLIEHPETATEEALKKAMTPIKSFYTRYRKQLNALTPA